MEVVIRALGFAVWVPGSSQGTTCLAKGRGRGFRGDSREQLPRHWFYVFLDLALAWSWKIWARHE